MEAQTETKMTSPKTKTKMTKPSSMVKMKVMREFNLKGEDGVEYRGAPIEGKDIFVEVPEDVAKQLEYAFKTVHSHSGLMEERNAKRHEIRRAVRV